MRELLPVPLTEVFLKIQLVLAEQIFKCDVQLNRGKNALEKLYHRLDHILEKRMWLVTILYSKQ